MMESVPDSDVRRASTTSRAQREGTEHVGAFGRTIGHSDLLFLEGQLPEDDGRIVADEPPARQLERCLDAVEAELDDRGATMADVVRLTIYLTDMEEYDAVNRTYERYVEAPYPARTTVGVCELLGGAAVTVDAVAALE